MRESLSPPLALPGAAAHYTVVALRRPRYAPSPSLFVLLSFLSCGHLARAVFRTHIARLLESWQVTLERLSKLAAMSWWWRAIPITARGNEMNTPKGGPHANLGHPTTKRRQRRND
jgi:hypothetical protein